MIDLNDALREEKHKDLKTLEKMIIKVNTLSSDIFGAH